MGQNFLARCCGLNCGFVTKRKFTLNECCTTRILRVSITSLHTGQAKKICSHEKFDELSIIKRVTSREHFFFLLHRIWIVVEKNFYITSVDINLEKGKLEDKA